MKRTKDPNRYPKGWNRKRVQAVITHYENQTDAQAIAEDEAAYRKGNSSATGVAMEKTLAVPVERIERRICVLRGHRVILSHDLATLYQVPVKQLNQAVKRNPGRFPADFMFQVARQEQDNLKSQIVTSSWGGARRALPYAFTEQGVAMLSSVLHSPRAVAVNVEIMRCFVRLRQFLATHADLAAKLASLERNYDHKFKVVFDAIRQLMIEPKEKRKPPIGFHTEAKLPGKKRTKAALIS